MTTRDPRFPRRPSDDGGRDPTQSLSLPPEDAYPSSTSHPSLALGTADAAEERTKVESPNARSQPPKSSTRPPPLPPKPGLDEPERVGTVLGSYKILELLGKGGMGYVFRAEHVKLGREVALKLLRSDYARRRDAVARFFQEARTVNRVRHRNIVDVTDFVELDDGTTFIIMELLRGQNLGKWARTGIDLPRALAVLVQICDGLGAAHQVGVVHRDLKPDNIIVVPTSDGAELVKLLDFGVAKLLNRDDEDIGFQTAAGSVIGTPAYMSPEQAGGMAIDARSDIYALGAIMYELFCGQPMFRGRSFGEYVRKHLTEMPVPPRATAQGRGIDPLLEQLILKCLEKDPNHRFESILELRDALLGMLGGMETHPPGSLSLLSSNIRPPAAVVAPALMPQLLPTLGPSALPQQPMIATAPTPHPGVASSLSGANPSVVFYPGYTAMMLPAPPAQPATPWWVWFVGGALAVGIGVAAAVWYAGRRSASTEPVTTAQPIKPQATPIEESAPVAPQLIELHFDSLPSGGVYAEGQAAELCKTPCATKLDLKDGGSTHRRSFIVKTTGYKDGRIDVDLTAATRDFQITLEREPTVTEVKPREPDVTEIPPRPADKVSKPRSGKPGKSGKKEPKDLGEPKAEEVKSLPTVQPDPVDAKKQDPGKKPGKIDKTETIDPFRTK